MNNDFYIGQIFEGKYPPEAAVWCNANNAQIVVVEKHKYKIEEMRSPTQEEKNKIRIEELKALLGSTDYKIIKCTECSLSGLELPYDIIELRATRQAIRDEINQLQGVGDEC